MALLQVSQHAKDLMRASVFYQDLLGGPPVSVFDPPGLVFFLTNGIRLLLDRAAPSSLLYFEVADLHAVLERLRRDGVTVETEPKIVFGHEDDTLGPAGTSEWQAFVRDTEGNLVGLVEHRRNG